MIANQDLDRIQGATAYDSTGEKVGKVGQIYTDDATGEPTWVAVSTGLFGLSESLAPLANATLEGDDDLRLSYNKQMIKDAPRVEGDQSLDADEERRLYEYYGLDYAVGGPEKGDGTGSLGTGDSGDLGGDAGYGGGQGGYAGPTQRTGDVDYTGQGAGYEAGDVVERGQTGYDSTSRLRLRRYLEEGRG